MKTLELLIVIVAFVMPVTTYAYIDPASTSFTLQAIVGACAAVTVVARRYWRRVFERLVPRPDQSRPARERE